MSGPTGVPRHRTFDPTVSSHSERRAPSRPARRPAPRHRALAMALGTLAAPALAVLALTAFGAVGDEPEEGLGSLQAAEGLQGSAAGAPEPGGESVAGQARDERDDDEGDSEFVDAEPDREGGEARREPAPSDCFGDGPRAETSKATAKASSAGAAAGCGEDDAGGQVDGDLAPEPGATTGPPVAGAPSPGTTPDDGDGGDDPDESSGQPGSSGYSSP